MKNQAESTERSSHRKKHGFVTLLIHIPYPLQPPTQVPVATWFAIATQHLYMKKSIVV